MKRMLILIIFLAIFITSCQGNIPTTTEVLAETEAVQITDTPIDTPVETETLQTTESSEQTSTPSDEVASSDSPPPGCTVVSPRPTPGPTEQSLFPPANEEDWVSGPENAAITIIEYSDFQ